MGKACIPQGKSADLSNVLFQGFTTQWFRVWSTSSGSEGFHEQKKKREERRGGEGVGKGGERKEKGREQKNKEYYR